MARSRRPRATPARGCPDSPPPRWSGGTPPSGGVRWRRSAGPPFRPSSPSRAAAAARGARPGMSATEAATRVPDLLGRLEDPEAERPAADALLDAAWTTSPRVEVVEPGCLVLDLSGLARLLGDESRIGARLQAAGEAIELPVRVGIGATRTVARLAAREGTGSSWCRRAERRRFSRRAPWRSSRHRRTSRSRWSAGGSRRSAHSRRCRRRRSSRGSDRRRSRFRRSRAARIPGRSSRTGIPRPAARPSRSTGRCRRSPPWRSSSSGSLRGSRRASPSARPGRSRSA